MVVASCWLPHAGDLMLVASCWLPHAGCLMLVASCWLPHAGCLMLVASCWWPHAGCLMLVAACWWPHAGCLMLVASCWLPHAGCFLSVSHFSCYPLLHAGPTWTKLSPLCSWCWNPSSRASGAKPYRSWSQLMWLPTFECTTPIHSPPSLSAQITFQSFSEWTWCCQICTVRCWAGMPQYSVRKMKCLVNISSTHVCVCVCVCVRLNMCHIINTYYAVYTLVSSLVPAGHEATMWYRMSSKASTTQRRLITAETCNNYV